jgi:hypothetical protein
MVDFFFSLVCSPAAVAAVVLAMYYVFPSPLVQGYLRFGGYILAGLQRKSIKTKNFHFGYYERSPLPRNGNRDAATKPDAAGTTNSAHPTLLFLHGFTSNKESWVRVVMGLPRQWRILVLDMPGHGESSFDPTQDYSPFGMAEKVDMVQRCVCVCWLSFMFILSDFPRSALLMFTFIFSKGLKAKSEC